MIDTTINRGLVRSGAQTSYKNYRQQPKPPATVRERDYNYRQHPGPPQAPGPGELKLLLIVPNQIN